MSALRFLRRNVAGVVALALVLVLFLSARLPGVSSAEQQEIAAHYAFTPLSIGLPGGAPQHEVRQVNQDYRNISSWISAVGAGISMNDLDGNGLSDDLCVVDTRTDQVSVTPAPVPGAAPRYAPYALDARPLPMSPTIAPMGCTPADVDENGRMDLIVYYWGRTPVVFLSQPGVPQGPAAWKPTEMVPNAGGPTYTGAQWNTNAVAVDDFDGDGHDDIYVGNYFPDGPVLDPTTSGRVAMNDSLSNATNAGPDHVLRWTGATPGQSASFTEQPDVLPPSISDGWVLASAANDVDGDLRPDLYLSQDHGRDAMLHNVSTPGHIAFTPVGGAYDPTVPKSKRIGADSFKGMGIDFADLDRNGTYDMFVSNITTSFGIEESNFQWMNTASTPQQVGAALDHGTAPWRDESTREGTAWSGWSWDAKAADFDNSGRDSIAQTTGFVKGAANRWAQLQELATANDATTANPADWPKVTPGSDLSGNQTLKFWAPRPGGGYTDLSHALGLDVPVPTRGIATGDADGDGRLDMAVARQWDQPAFYHNVAPDPGAEMTLNLVHDGPSAGPGSPAVGAQVLARMPDGTPMIDHVDGGSGHSGKRSSEVHLGLGAVTTPVPVTISWRDRAGAPHTQTVTLGPGRHTVALGQGATVRDQVEEKR